jgi:putative endonuclease
MDNPLPPPGQHCVYALLCDDGSIYIGWTSDLTRRFRQHQAGTAARWTKKHRPVRILAFEPVASRGEAMQLERAWKTGKGRYRLRKMATTENVTSGARDRSS